MARLALLSTSNKTGLVDLAHTLVTDYDFSLISSGGTADTLQAAGLPVTRVSDYTGFPEILGGRVKTLHPWIHGGILARRDLLEDQQDLRANQIQPIDLVVVNLYPFEQTIAKPEVTIAAAIEQIDIGGPALIRAAAKNYAHVCVLSAPTQYEPYLEELHQQNGETSLAFRQASAHQAFLQTASYDRAIADYLGNQLPGETDDGGSLPCQLTLSGQQLQPLRYGENPHQPAAWYQTGSTPTGWTAATKLQGKALSYNNLVDLEAARQIIAEFTEPDSPPTAAILKHTNPCGVAQATSLQTAYQAAFDADPVSAFGGIVALNQAIDLATATALGQTFLECVVAPGCEPAAVEMLTAKSKVRVLILPNLNSGPDTTVRLIAGGLLAQTSDHRLEDGQQWQGVTQAQPTSKQLAEMLFAWKVAKHVKSNAIAVTRNKMTLGIGAGQMNRVGAVKLALEQAGTQAKGATLASDGFFPFDDSVRTAAAAGVRAIIQPGGSLRDQDSIQAANELGLVMVFTHVRHFLH